MYGIEVSTPYGIDEDMVATCGFFYNKNHKVQRIRARKKDFRIDRGKSIQSPKFSFNGNYNSNIWNIIYSYK